MTMGRIFGRLADAIERISRPCAQALAALSILVLFRNRPNSIRGVWRLALGALAALFAYLGSGLPGWFEKSDGTCCGRGEVALQIALADAYCGEKNRIWPIPNFFADLDPASANLPLKDYIPRKLATPDLASACKRLTPYASFHEYSTSALLKTALWLPPDDTPISLMAKARMFVFLVMLAAGAMLAFCRLGLLPIYLASEAAFAMADVLEPIWWTDYYYYLPALLIFGIALSSVFGIVLAHANRLAVFSCATFAGIALVVVMNFRTTYGIALAGGLAAAGLMALVVHLIRKTRGPDLAAPAAAFVVLLASAAAANAVLFQSFRVAGTASEIEHHLVWHPVVLGLANPGTPFTRAEGIAWDDSMGVMLAQRVDADAQYMTPEYESALKAYYFSLWRNHPGEMLRAYWSKFAAFGVDYARILRQFGYSEAFASIGIRGAALMAAMALLTAVMAVAWWKSRHLELLFLTVTVTAFIFMMGLEYVLILPNFYYTHNSASLSAYILFEWCLIASIACWLLGRFSPVLNPPTNAAARAASLGATFRFVAPTLVLLAAFVLGESAIRRAAGYSLRSAPLVRTDDARIEEKPLRLVPRPFRLGLYGSSRPPEPADLRAAQRLWTSESGARPFFPGRVLSPPLREPFAVPFRYPADTMLPGGIRTDRAGLARATDGEPSAAQPAIRIVLVGSDFVFGEDSHSLPRLLQAELDRRAEADARLAGKTFAVFSLARERLAEEFFASVIAIEAAELAPELMILDGGAPPPPPPSGYVVLRKLRIYNPAFSRELEWQSGAEILRRPRWSALLDAFAFPLREFPMKYYWKFAEHSGERDASRRALLEDPLRAARDAGCRTMVLGPRQPVRPHQTFPRDRRSFRLNYYKENGPLRTKHAYQVFKHDDAFGRALAAEFGAEYFSFAPIAGRLRYFDDDLTLSRTGYRWAAEALAARIVDMTVKGDLRSASQTADAETRCGGTRDVSQE